MRTSLYSFPLFRQVLLPIVGALWAYTYVVLALGIEMVPLAGDAIVLLLCVQGIALLNECTSLRLGDMPNYFMTCLHSIAEPIAYAFLILFCAQFLGVVQIVPEFNSLVALLGAFVFMNTMILAVPIILAAMYSYVFRS